MVGWKLSGAPQLSLAVSTLQQVFPTVVGDMDSSGSLNAQVLLLLAERLRAKAVFQVIHGSCLHPLKHVLFLHECPALGRSREKSRAGVTVRGRGEVLTPRSPYPDTAGQVPDVAVRWRVPGR